MSEYLPFDDGAWYNFHTAVCTDVSDSLLMLVRPVGSALAGLLVGVVSTLPFTNARVASELYWFVDPAHRTSKTGLQLFVGFERWAEASGALLAQVGLQGGCRESLRLNNFYLSKRYRYHEKIYYKDLRKKCVSQPSPLPDLP